MSYFRSHKMDAYRLYLLISAGTSFFFTLVFSVNMVYQVQTIGLSPLELVLVGTTLELSVLLFEIPTGVVSDVYSRRLSIIIGFVLIGLGFMVEGTIASFGGMLIAQVLWGIGYTFTSGAQEAWITDEIGEEQVGRAFMRASQVGNLISILATLIAVALGSLLINLPIVLGGTLFVALAVWLALYMPETGFKPTPREERNTWGQMTDTLRAGTKLVRRSSTLMAIMGIGLFLGLSSEGVDRLSTAHLLESFTLPDFGGLQPVVWLGILGMIGSLLSAGATQLVMKRLDTASNRALGRASFLIVGLSVGAVIAFALAGNFWLAVVFSMLTGVFRSLFGPIESTWINQNLDSNVRATVISMRGQVDAFGQTFGGPPVGWVGNTFGIRAALVSSALILSPALVLYTRLLRRPDAAIALPDEAAVVSEEGALA
jgi:DHA3 family tetracycline resistance protein-like MFS transporter